MANLFIGIKGTVLAVEPASGKIAWQSHLHGAGFVNVLLHGGQLFASTHGEVFRLDPGHGEIAWHTSLGSDFVNVVLEGGQLFAACQGELYCLDPATGEIRWKNELKGMGFGLITIAQSPDGNRAVVEEKHRQDEIAASDGAEAALM